LHLFNGERFEVVAMTKLFEKISLKLVVVIIGLTIVLSSCEEPPGEWEKEDIKTEYGDYFEHFYRFVPGGFNDPRYEHRILYNGKELLSYTKEHEDSGVKGLYNDDTLTVYYIHRELYYRTLKENEFHLLPFDTDKKEFYPAYYQLLLQGSIDIMEMLVSSDDKYAKKVVVSYAKGDFSEAEKNNIYLESGEDKRLIDYCSWLVEEYHLTE
jgi:hypothetical protein